MVGATAKGTMTLMTKNNKYNFDRVTSMGCVLNLTVMLTMLQKKRDKNTENILFTSFLELLTLGQTE